MTKITNDTLHRLTTFARGTLNTGHTAITGTASSTGSWTLDANGNWTSVDTDGSTENRTYNQQNEVTSVGSGTLAYDDNGDYTEGGYRFDGLGYDAWRNAMTGAQTEYPDGSTYGYDALGRRITTAALTGGSPTHLYYDAYGNVIEERIGTSTSASVQYVWSPYGVNQLVERDRDTDANGTLDERLYVQQDANGNVTSLINTSGTVVERYIYTPYGQVTVLTGSFGSRSTTSYAWNYLFQGERYDWTAGLYHMGAREYDPQLGRFLQQDPMGYVDGANRYQFVLDNPLSRIDPWGTYSAVALPGNNPSDGGVRTNPDGSVVIGNGSDSGNGTGNPWGGGGMSLDGLSPGWTAGKGRYLGPGNWLGSRWKPNGAPGNATYYPGDGWYDPTPPGGVPGPGPGYNPGCPYASFSDCLSKILLSNEGRWALWALGISTTGFISTLPVTKNAVEQGFGTETTTLIAELIAKAAGRRGIQAWLDIGGKSLGRKIIPEASLVLADAALTFITGAAVSCEVSTRAPATNK